MEFGIISVLPVLTILVIAVTTRRTLFAMTCGLTVAAVILGFSDGFRGIVDAWFNYLYVSFSGESFQWLALIIAMFGMLIAMFEKSNAVADFGVWASKFIKTRKQAMVGTVILGTIIFIDDYLSNLATGTTMRGMTDRLGIPRTHLVFLVNCTAAPVCLLIPISSWGVFFGQLLEGQGVTVNGSGLAAYIHGLPFAFYAWFVLIIVVLSAFDILPKLGLIKKDYKRYEETGNVFPEGYEVKTLHSGEKTEVNVSANPHPWNFIIPLAVMIAVSIWIDVLYGATAGLVVGFIIYLVGRRLSFYDALTTCFEGILSMGFVFVLIALAFAVQGANLDLGLADYVISVTKPIMHGGFLPAAVFVVCGIYAYATGCFWDMAAIIIPIVIPLANAMGVDPILAAAAVFSGAALGSTTCLYGDGVIMASQGVELKTIHTMLAILPYAAIAFVLSTIAYLICGFVL